MKGLLVFNRSYLNAQVLAHLDAFCKAFEDLEPINNLHVGFENTGNLRVMGADIPKYDYALFWDKDILLARAIEAFGLRLFNSANAVEVCDDKRLTALCMNGIGISMPKTISAPLLYNAENEGTELADYIISELGLPIVVKEAKGSMGTGVYLIKDRFELLRIRRKLIKTPHLYQEFISESAGVDYRYYIVGGEIFGAVKRFNKSDFRSNLSAGGEMTLIEPSLDFVKPALKVSNALGLDFGAVDFIVRDGKPLLCEVNSNPFFLSYFRLCGKSLAERIAEYVSLALNNT